MYLHRDRWFRRRLGFRLQRLKEFLFGSGESRSNKSCSHPFGKANSWKHLMASCFVRSVSVLKAILSTPVVFPFLAHTHHIHQPLHYRFVSLEWINKLRIFDGLQEQIDANIWNLVSDVCQNTRPAIAVRVHLLDLMVKTMQEVSASRKGHVHKHSFPVNVPYKLQSSIHLQIHHPFLIHQKLSEEYELYQSIMVYMYILCVRGSH